MRLLYSSCDCEGCGTLAAYHTERFVLHLWGRCLLRNDQGEHLTLRPEEFVSLFCTEGLTAFDRLEGQFAVALYDTREHKIYLARDSFGTYQLYHARGIGWIAYADTMPCLMGVRGFSRDIDPAAVSYFLREGWAPPFTTFLAAVRPVRPGHLEVLTITSEHIRKLPPRPDDYRRRQRRSRPADLLSLLRQSVRDCGPADGQRIGISLSGGIDSAAVVALLSEAFPNTKLNSYTVGFGEDDPEIQGARATAAHFKTHHHELILTPHDIEGLIEETVEVLGNPGGYDELPCLHALWKNAAREVDLLYSGNVSDAIFSGMSTHWRLWKARRLGPFSLLFARATATQRGYHHVTDASVDPCVLNQTPEREFRHWASSARTQFEALASDLSAWDERTGAQTTLARHHGLEMRLPFAQRYLIDFALRTNDRDKVNMLGVKRILRRALAPVLPTSITRRKKGLQHLRYDTAMQQLMIKLCERYLSLERVTARGLLNPRSTERLMAQIRQEITPTNFRFAWNAVLFEIWCQRILDPSPNAKGPLDLQPSMNGPNHLPGLSAATGGAL
ncbi:asparagine synthase (glutamine-hydrolysing) [Rhizobium sp. ERR 1071]|nr:asparagine synthase (glutamine-hydrolysing) [Rhizobium sp. ERR1071]